MLTVNECPQRGRSTKGEIEYDKPPSGQLSLIGNAVKCRLFLGQFATHSLSQHSEMLSLFRFIISSF